MDISNYLVFRGTLLNVHNSTPGRSEQTYLGKESPYIIPHTLHTWVLCCCCFFGHHIYFPAQSRGRVDNRWASGEGDKPWSQVSFLLPPGTYMPWIALIWPTHALALLTTGDSFTGVRNREASPAGETTAVCHLDCRTYSKLCFTDVVCCVSVQRRERSHQGASLQARYAHANRRHDVCTPLEKDLGTRWAYILR